MRFGTTSLKARFGVSTEVVCVLTALSDCYNIPFDIPFAVHSVLSVKNEMILHICMRDHFVLS